MCTQNHCKLFSPNRIKYFLKRFYVTADDTSFMTSFVIADTLLKLLLLLRLNQSQRSCFASCDWLGRIGLLLTRAVRHLAAQTFAAIGGFTVRDGLVGQ